MKPQLHLTSMSNSNPKQFSPQLQLMNIFSYFFFFGCGLTTGVVISSYKNTGSVDLHVTQFSFSTTSRTPVSRQSMNQSSVNYSTRIGLNQFIKVPDLKHDMTEDELLWRASIVPRIQMYPFKRVPKIGFLFLTKGPVFMSSLWELFFKGYEKFYSIYVHSSPGYDETQIESPPFRGRRIPSQDVLWGDVNMVEAERRLLGNALMDISIEWFVLLSESCIPLYNFSTVYTYLIRSTKNFVEVYDLDDPVGRGRYSPKMKPEIQLEQWRKGSQWFAIDRDLAVRFVSDRKYISVFQNHCKDQCYADEHYLPTYVSIKYSSKNSNRTLTWVDWSKGGPHPYRYSRTDVTQKFLEKLRSGSRCTYNGRTTNICYLFARKFLPNTLDRLLRFAPSSLYFHR